MKRKKKAYNRLKAVLAEKRKTNLWLAQTIGVNKTTVSRWRTNDMQPTVENLFIIADTLRVKSRELLLENKSY